MVQLLSIFITMLFCLRKPLLVLGSVPAPPAVPGMVQVVHQQVIRQVVYVLYPHTDLVTPQPQKYRYHFAPLEQQYLVLSLGQAHGIGHASVLVVAQMLTVVLLKEIEVMVEVMMMEMEVVQL